MNGPPLIFDAHLDLALNAMEWNRDLRRPVVKLRALEKGMNDKAGRANGTVSLPEMRRGGVGICIATLLARIEHNAYSPVFGWRSAPQAWAQTQGQLAWYRAMERSGEMVPLRNRAELEKHLALWRETAGGRNSQPQPDALQRVKNRPAASPSPDGQTGSVGEGRGEAEQLMPQGDFAAHGEKQLPIGYILSLEGADSILSPKDLEGWFEQGLRLIGPAHYGPGVYANGTDATGGLNERGRELLREIDRLGFVLDVTHFCDESFRDALDLFQGPVLASHQNCRALVPHPRQFSDEQIKELIRRGAVIGAAMDAWMLVPGWVRGKTTPESAGVTLEHFVDHIDHVCQLTGNANHSGIGSDLDGAFGREQTPCDLDTIADLAGVAGRLARRGYKPEDINAITHGNFINFFQRAWK
jgi:membrane dipeptidase